MKTRNTILTLLFGLIMLGACSWCALHLFGYSIPTNYTNVNDLDGFSFRFASKSGNTITLVLDNQTAYPCTYGEEYHLEKLKNGSWFESARTNKKSWTAIAYPIEAGHSATLTFSLSLSSGTYRIVKKVSCEISAVERKSRYLAAEFTIS